MSMPIGRILALGGIILVCGGCAMLSPLERVPSGGPQVCRGLPLLPEVSQMKRSIEGGRLDIGSLKGAMPAKDQDLNDVSNIRVLYLIQALKHSLSDSTEYRLSYAVDCDHLIQSMNILSENVAARADAVGLKMPLSCPSSKQLTWALRLVCETAELHAYLEGKTIHLYPRSWGSDERSPRGSIIYVSDLWPTESKSGL